MKQETGNLKLDTEETAGVEASPPQATEEGGSGGSARGITMPGDHVQATLTRLLADGAIDEAGRDAIWWFYSHARDGKTSYSTAARLINRDATTLYRVFSGTYGAGYGGVVGEIVRYRKLAEQRAKRKEIGFIETSTWRKIHYVCAAALSDSMPAYIYGASQIGKTECLLEHARRNNHGQTRYVRMPAAPTLRLFLAELAEACYISTRIRECDMRRRICGALNDRTLLIVDEMHQAMILGEMTARRIVEAIREIYDRTHCGLVLCGTNVFREECLHGRQAGVYAQTWRRGLVNLQLPDIATKADCIKIAAAFGLPEPPEEVWRETIVEMLRDSGLGKYIKYLQLAHGLATGRRQAIEWKHFTQAVQSIAALSAATDAPGYTNAITTRKRGVRK